MFKKINCSNVYLTMIMIALAIMFMLVLSFFIISIILAFFEGFESTLDLVIFINRIAFVIVYTVSLTFLVISLVKTQKGKSFLINVNEDLQTIKVIQDSKNKLFISLSLSFIIILPLTVLTLTILEIVNSILLDSNLSEMWILFLPPSLFLGVFYGRFITSEYWLRRFIKSNIKNKREDSSISFNELREMASKLNKKLYGFSIYRYEKIQPVL